ncbi:hypothetical protein [[Kitasatospora] papulosa]|uniref:hypothetical protein n=1 Tax=[Kitasatospora] papulosa TaxID=1464011 RepID=UPI002E3578DA|nr:hypothetical protein [[Kitasatospora] papulosa]
MMRAAGFDLGSPLGFVIVINLGGIVGMLVGGRLTAAANCSRPARPPQASRSSRRRVSSRWSSSD